MGGPKMQNAYREIKKVIQDKNLTRDQLVHALMATVFSRCCDTCAENLRSEEFNLALDRLASDLLLCAEMSKQNAA
jgi:hypothetical protein